MRHAISYVSSKRDYVTNEEIQKLLHKTYTYNNAHDIHGLLVYSEGSFFQLIEGEKENIKNLYYDKIEKDPRHKDIIKFIEKEISLPSYDGYFVDFAPSRFEIDQSKLETYIDYIKVLEPEIRKPVIKVLSTFAPNV